MRGILRVGGALVLAISAYQPSAFAAGDVAAGKALAERSCSSCHLVSSDQASATTEAPPFETIAERPLDQIEAFLAAPHPPMPPLTLTRQEIGDIVAYIESLKPAQ